MPPPPSGAELLEQLAALSRPPGSNGARQAAQLIAEALRRSGWRARVEAEDVHGTYWVPIGIAAATAAMTRWLPRAPAAVLALACALSNADDLEIGRRPLRWVLRRREALNVVGELGPEPAPTTLVVHAHHDAARTGLVFHPAGARLATRFAGRLMDRMRSTPPPMAGAVLGPLLAAAGAALQHAGARGTGAALSAGYALAMADIARRPAVPGANDNLSSVAVLLELAQRLARRPPDALRVVLLSTGAEESFLEGMDAFGARHFKALPASRTSFLCLESVGSPQLMLLDGEGLLRLHRYPVAPISRLSRLARERGIPLREPFRYRLATDGQVPLRAGYPTAVITSMDWYHAPSNYHWPTDRPENLDRATLARAADLAEAYIRDMDSR
jgi:hypothetical protein